MLLFAKLWPSCASQKLGIRILVDLIIVSNYDYAMQIILSDKMESAFVLFFYRNIDSFCNFRSFISLIFC